MDTFNFNQPIPLLFVGDAPDSTTGLGRIGHDLAWLASSMPEYQVGYMGREGFGRAKFPWAQYSFSSRDQWGERLIQEAWGDLSQGRHGIIFTVWDASRLLWFADGRGTGMEEFLGSGQFRRWGYFMADGCGVRAGQLPMEQTHVVACYNRAVMASRWAHQMAVESVHEPADLDWLPHPINRNVFRPQGRAFMRSAWGIGEVPLVGCVMANQARKHWPVVMAAIKLLPRNTRMWMHTDTLLHYWDLQALAAEYGIAHQIITDNRALSDIELAMRYSACDATVVISGGEGFCYPVAESLSCGVPAVTGTYGAQAELTPWTVPYAALAVDTSHNVTRAVYDAGEVAEGIAAAIEAKPPIVECEARVLHLDMKHLGLLWKRWFRKGLQ